MVGRMGDLFWEGEGKCDEGVVFLVGIDECVWNVCCILFFCSEGFGGEGGVDV